MRFSTPFSLVLLMSACIETNVNSKDDATDGLIVDTAPPDCPPHIPDCEDTEAPDDTQGGDTGEPNPEDCAVELASAGSVKGADVCEGAGVPTVTDPWNVQIEWRIAIEYTYHPGLITNLTDDDGDGDVDEMDTPDIAYVTGLGRLLVVDGATGVEHWGFSGFESYAIGALADVDSDGVTDILSIKKTGEVVALRANGAKIWESAVPSTGVTDFLTVADLNGDGAPEVISTALVLNGQDGSVLWEPELTDRITYHAPIAADLDQDGDQEVIIQDTVYDSDGTLLWSGSIQGRIGHWSAVLNYDSDKEAEIAMIGDARLAIYEHDGTEILNSFTGLSQPGPPCVGDFDGDGKAEIAVPSEFTLTAYELNGAKMWTANIFDPSGAAGCSAYDFDGDGALEILFADQSSFYIFDGATGAVNFESADHGSGTGFEYPTVADVDNDGSAEVIVSSSEHGLYEGITVFGHFTNGWPKSGPTWSVHDFALTNINSDGSVPARPEPYWVKHNVFRARPAIDDPATSDLTIEFTEHCVASCVGDGLVRIALQAQNVGTKTSFGPTPWALYAVDDTVSLIATGTLPKIAPGEKTAGWEVDILATQFGRAGLMVAIDDDGTGVGVNEECVEDNNQDFLYDAPCGW